MSQRLLIGSSGRVSRGWGVEGGGMEQKGKRTQGGDVDNSVVIVRGGGQVVKRVIKILGTNGNQKIIILNQIQKRN